MSEAGKAMRRWLHRIRLYFLTGLVALVPMAVTAYILWHIFFTIDNWLSGAFSKVPWLTVAGRPLPGIGFLTVVLLVILTGVLTRNLLGRQFLRVAEQQLTRIPVFRSLYGGAKQLTQALLGGRRKMFRAVVLIPFPTRGLYAIAFHTAEAAPEIARRTGDDLVSVFLPTTPNPTSGYLLAVRRDETIFLDMTVEEAIKLVISGGAVMPEDRAAALAGDTVAAAADDTPADTLDEAATP